MANDIGKISRIVFRTAYGVALNVRLKELKKLVRGSVLVLGAGYDPHRKHLPNDVNAVTLDIDEKYGTDIVADAHKIPVDDDFFDCVLAFDVLEHVHSPHLVLSEIRRVLKDNGTVVASVPFMFRVHGDPYDFNRMTEHGLTRLFGRGFNVQVLPFGSRLHVISDIVTTSHKSLVIGRIFNHLLGLPIINRLVSRDCPIGYWVLATAIEN